MVQNDKYDDIINLPHHVSSNHPQMSMINRAAQFAPFSALTGHDAAIQETARLTDAKMDLDEYEKEEINNKIQKIINNLGEKHSVTFTYFLPDLKKSGGSYQNATGVVKKIDEQKRIIILQDESRIPIDDVIAIDIND